MQSSLRGCLCPLASRNFVKDHHCCLGVCETSEAFLHRVTRIWIAPCFGLKSFQHALSIPASRSCKTLEKNNIHAWKLIRRCPFGTTPPSAKKLRYLPRSFHLFGQQVRTNCSLCGYCTGWHPCCSAPPAASVKPEEPTRGLCWPKLQSSRWGDTWAEGFSRQEFQGKTNMHSIQHVFYFWNSKWKWIFFWSFFKCNFFKDLHDLLFCKSCKPCFPNQCIVCDAEY